MRTSPVPFFLISLGLHLVLFFPLSNAPEIEKIREPIPVAFLPFADVMKVEPLREVERQKPAVRPARSKAQTQRLARKPDRLGETPRPLPEVKYGDRRSLRYVLFQLEKERLLSVNPFHLLKSCFHPPAGLYHLMEKASRKGRFD